MSQLTPIFESLRQKEDLPCSYPLHMHAPSYHWVNKKKRKKTLSTVFIFCCRWCDVTRVFVSIPLYRFNHFFFFFFILFSPSPSVFFSLLRYIIFPSFFNVFFQFLGDFSLSFSHSLFVELCACHVCTPSLCIASRPMETLFTILTTVHISYRLFSLFLSLFTFELCAAAVATVAKTVTKHVRDYRDDDRYLARPSPPLLDSYHQSFKTRRNIYACVRIGVVQFLSFRFYTHARRV